MNSHENIHKWPINDPAASQVCRSQWAMTADLTVFPKVTAVTVTTWTWFVEIQGETEKYGRLKPEKILGLWLIYVLFDNGIS